MSARILLFCAVFVVCVPLLAQVEPSASGGPGPTDNDESMDLPPQVSGDFYPSSVGDTERANTLSFGLIEINAYDRNVFLGEATRQGAESFTLLPSLSLSTSTTRTRGSLSYSPGFTFYHPTSDLNAVTQNLVADFHYRATPRTTLGLDEVFSQNSTVFSQPYTIAGATISGSGESTSPALILPYASQMTDTTSARIGYQFSRTAMFGASGNFTSFNYSNLPAGEILVDANSGGGSAYYDKRVSRSQYLGIRYNYSITETTPYPSTIQNHTGTLFYTIYPVRSVTLSVSAGPELSMTTAPGTPSFRSWTPNVLASMGWHNLRTNLAVSYFRSVTTGWGILGSYTSDAAALTLSHELSRRLIAGASGNYANTKDVTPLLVGYFANGHSLYGRGSLEYKFDGHFAVVGEYMHLHEAYTGIAALATNPNDDRVSITLNYRFTRPLGQ